MVEKKAHGGKRPGAGRKPAPKPPESLPAPPESPPVVVDEADPVEFLIGVMQGKIEAKGLQVRAAIAAAQYRVKKVHDGAKKDEQAAAAKKAAGGKFAAAQPPLKLVGRK